MLTRFLNSELDASPTRVFLSFTTMDKPSVDVFSASLKSQYANLVLLNHAVVDKYGENWKFECAAKIDQSLLLICLIGTTTHLSEAVAWEIHQALSCGKRVVAFNLTNRDVCLPGVLIQNSIEPMPYEAFHESGSLASV